MQKGGIITDSISVHRINFYRPFILLFGFGNIFPNMPQKSCIFQVNGRMGGKETQSFNIRPNKSELNKVKSTKVVRPTSLHYQNLFFFDGGNRHNHQDETLPH